jgi:hypothetical protein
MFAASTFGCERCWPAAPESAWEARRALTKDLDLVDESHFHVAIGSCGRVTRRFGDCGQRFISVFTETIDWVDGDDPQDWTQLPLTADEAGALRRAGDALESRLNNLGRERRSLRRDSPKGCPPRLFWSTGVFVGRHD